MSPVCLPTSSVSAFGDVVGLEASVAGCWNSQDATCVDLLLLKPLKKKLRRLGSHQPRWLRQPTVEERHGEDGGEGGVQEGVQRQCHHRPNDLCWHQGGRQRCLPGGPIDHLIDQLIS